jgi:hypothetical protein
MMTPMTISSICVLPMAYRPFLLLSYMSLMIAGYSGFKGQHTSSTFQQAERRMNRV